MVGGGSYVASRRYSAMVDKVAAKYKAQLDEVPNAPEPTETELTVVCIPDPVPSVRRESGYFRSLIRRYGDGTEGEIDGGDHRLLA